jgi:hypothetical protein
MMMKAYVCNVGSSWLMSLVRRRCSCGVVTVLTSDFVKGTTELH